MSDQSGIDPVTAVNGAPNAESRTPILVAEGIAKNYGAVKALDGVSLSLYEGEVVALVGDNGAGKSTFSAILSGVIQPDAGTITVDGKKVWIDNPTKAHQFGIVTVFQDLALVNERDVAANLFLGREPTWFGLIVNRRRMVKEASDVIAHLRVGLPNVRALVGGLSGGQRQAIAVARAVVRGNTRVVIMDEPTAALGVREAQRVGDLIKELRTQGHSVLLVSHNIESVFELADRVVVFRLGRKIAEHPIAMTTREEVVSLIVRGER
jgi:D-xylose transport system ATP-binding protein